MKLMIIDGNSILNRAFYGVRTLNAPDGTPTNAVFGFLNIFRRVYSEINPDAVCVSFDVHAPTFRHRACCTYKATRRPMPDELRVQLPIIKNVLEEMNIKVYEAEGYEADDVIGTVSRICEESGVECVAVTGDKDSLQLVSEKTSVVIIKTAKGETTTTVYTPDRFRSEYGFEPACMVDLKALMGDSSDNISGVPGIGEKTALDILRRAGSLDAVYETLDTLEIKDSIRRKLREGERSARESFWLATIFREVPLAFEPSDNLWNGDYRPGLYDLFRQLGFNRMIEKLHLQKKESEKEETDKETKEVKEPLNEIQIDSDCVTDALDKFNRSEFISVLCRNGLDEIEIFDGDTLYHADRVSMFMDYVPFLQKLFSSEIVKVSADIKNIMRMLIEEGLPADGFVFDCTLADYMIEGGNGGRTIADICMAWFNREENGAAAVYSLYIPMRNRLNELGMERLYFSVELPLCRCLAEMECKGFLVERNALSEFGNSLSSQIEAVTSSIYAMAGHEFNINSTRQLGEVLFEELSLPNGKKTKTGWSTSAEVLGDISAFHPIVGQVLEYRMLTKLKSTYAEGLLKVISNDGRIHTNFQMTVTATGRLSSTEPNLQNIPVRKSLGAQIRGMFIAPPGSVLVDADYSQIELRILAHISGDDNMIRAFKSGEDFHTLTAASVFGIPVSQVTPELRSRAKAVNFGIVYGMAAFTLAKDTNVSVREAKEYMEAYFSEYPSVDKYLRDVVEKAKKDGYVTTIFGRRRYVPELSSSSHAVREFGKRVALNMPIQGTAADIMKMAMVSVRDRLEAEGLKARLVLQVHDELIVECPVSEREKVEVILRECMENVASFLVPLPAETGYGRSWADAH